MSRTLTAFVAEQVSKRVLAEIPMLTMTRIVDHSVPTKTAPFTCTTHPMQLILGTDPEVPFLSAVTFPVETMPHLPSAASGGTDSLTRRIRFTLFNALYEDVTLYEFLTSLARLDRAEITLQTLVVPANEMTSQSSHLSFIHGGRTLGERVSYFTGLIDRVQSVGEVIECTGVSALPVTPWKLVPDTAEDRRDRGLRLPLLLGFDAVSKCVNLSVGAFTSLAQRMSIGATQATLTFADDFPTGAGSAMVGAEKISWLTRDGDTLLNVTRGVDGSTESDHISGSAVLELANLVIGVASNLISSVKDLFIISTTTQLPIRIPNLLYTVDYVDETNAPGVSGDGIATASFNPGQLAAVINTIVADNAVTQQADYTLEVPADIFEFDDPTKTADNATFARTAGAAGDWTAVTTAPNWAFNRNGGSQEGLRGSFGDGFTKHDDYPLLAARFDFTLDVASMTSPISVGLAITGVEGVLVGAIDDTIVASTTIAAGTSGTVTIQGTVFQAHADQDLNNLHTTAILNFIIGEPAGGNPTMEFEVTLIQCEYTLQNLIGEIEETSQVDFSDQLTQYTRTGFTEVFNGNWTFPPSPNLGQSNAPASTADQAMHARWTTAAFATTFPTLNLLIDPPNVLLHRVSFNGAVTASGAGITNISANSNAEDINGWSDVFDSPLSDTAAFFTAPGTGNLNHGADTKAGATISDALDTDLSLFNNNVSGTNDPSRIVYDRMRMTITTEATTETTPIDQSVPAQIQASAGGIGLQFFALCDGPIADDTSWIADDDEVLSHPGDLMRKWFEIHGETNIDLDATTGFSGTDYDTATPGFQFGFDARNLGGTFEQVLLRMGYEGNANIYQPSGDDWTLSFPDVNGAFPTPTLTIDAIGDLISIGKDTDEIRTRLTVFYNFDPRFDTADNRSFTEVITTDPLDADVIAREVIFGRLDAEPSFLFAQNSDTGAANWVGYQEQELGRFARIFAFRVDSWQGFDLQLGDMRFISHPQVDSGVAVKARCIEFTRNQRSGFLVRFVEVL